MKARWELLLLPPLAVSLLLLGVSQFIFLRASLYKDLGLGRFGSEIDFSNYAALFQDPFYLNSLLLTVEVSVLVVLCSVLVGFPAAYVLARMQSKWSNILLSALVATSFVTIVIKVLGLIIIFSAEGPVNSALRWLALIDRPIRLTGTVGGVVVGLLHYTLGFMILVLFSVIQTIPRSLEEAALIHGASRTRTFWRIVVPLSLPGLIGGALIVFNLSMGAFTSAALLGGGRVLTLPVLIQRTILLENKYAMAAALSALLLALVLAINLASIVIVSRLRVASRGAAA